MSLVDRGTQPAEPADPNTEQGTGRQDSQVAGHHPSGLKRTGTHVLRTLGLAVAFVATVALAAGVAVVGPNIEEWHGRLPSLSEEGFVEKTDIQADEVFGWSEGQSETNTAAGADAKLPSGYAFLAPEQGSLTTPGHWCAQTPIGYRMDLTAARLAGLDPAVEQQRWQRALRKWQKASGDRYSFEYRGEAKYPLTKNTSRRDMNIAEDLIPNGEIAITYATSAKNSGPKWRDYRHRGLDTAFAFGGIGTVRWSLGAPDSGLITNGSIVIDADDMARTTESLPTVYIHEAGHALGLAHVDDPRQMMYKKASQGAKISGGDRRGIQELASAECPAQP